jgi:hypothetical protein
MPPGRSITLLYKQVCRSQSAGEDASKERGVRLYAAKECPVAKERRVELVDDHGERVWLLRSVSAGNQADVMSTGVQNLLLPSLSVRSSGGREEPSGSGDGHAAVLVNHVRDTEAWRGRTSVMVL